MENKYCLPIIKTTTAEISETINRLKDEYGYFEIWLDYIEDFNLDHILALIDQYPDRIILVFRRQNLDPVKIPPEQRRKVLDAVTNKNCLIDLDITAQTEELNYLKSSGQDKNLLCSYHNYESTPPDDELEKIVNSMEAYSPGIIKLSTMCNTKDDALRLLRLEQRLSGEGKRHIVLGMGENGLVTRIFATLWGNELAFIPETDDTSSAPGQITKDRFEKIIKELTD